MFRNWFVLGGIAAVVMVFAHDLIGQRGVAESAARAAVVAALVGILWAIGAGLRALRRLISKREGAN